MKYFFILKYLYHSSLWAVFMLLGLSACLNEDVSCVSESFDTVRVRFLKLDPSSPRQDTLAIASVFTDEGDLLLSNVLALGLALPLNPTANSVTFVVEWAEDTLSEFERDTLTFTYNREQRLISPECGVEQSYDELAISSNSFDSVDVPDSEVNLFDPTNVRIYTCQYEFTNIARAQFRRIDTTATEPTIITQEVRDTLVISSITDNFGNVIFSGRDTVSSARLPVDIQQESTSFFFDILVADGDTVRRFIDLSYFVDTTQIFDCRPQARVFNLDVDPEGSDFRNVEVTEEVLNQNNPTNLEIFF
ncbi:MAG: DUF6452 family protein [Cyclobacteriaceae bacterium]